MSTTIPLNRRKTLTIAIILAVLAAAGGIYWIWRAPDVAQAVRAGRAVPVTVTTAMRRDVPVVLTGLGTVQASFTVGIHAQVDGKLQEVLFSEGQFVKKGDLLAKIDPRLYQAALDQAKAKKAQDEAQLVALQKDLERFKTLSRSGFQSQQNIDQQQSKVDMIKAGIVADSAAIDAASAQLDYTTITAPSDGRMSVRLVDPGNIVRAGDQGSIAVLTRTRPIYVVFTLSAHTLDDVREAQARGPVEVVAYDRNNRKALSTGTLETIDNQIDPSTATYKLKALFANDDEKLWPGQFANARLQVGILPNAMVVPNGAVQRGPKGLFVWVIKPDNTAEARPIEAGPTVDDMTVIAAGLNDGERTVVNGQYRLQIGVTVTATDAVKPAGSS